MPDPNYYPGRSPVSSEPVNGVLKPQNGPGSPWEFCIKEKNEEKNELDKLGDYPVTRAIHPNGIPVTLINGNVSCPGHYHGAEAGSRFGANVFIGSRSRVEGPLALEEYRRFLKECFGVDYLKDTQHIQITMDFCSDGKVHVSLR